MRSMRRLVRAFTLIEMLVVIAITAILAALILPVLVTSREKSRRTSCMNNLAQISLASASYVDDYGGYLPGGLAWSADPGLTHAVDMPQMFPFGSAAIKGAGVLDPAAYGAATDQRNPMYNIWRPGCFFYSQKPGLANNDNDWVAGQLNAAPCGLSTLMYTSALLSGKIFTCPSLGMEAFVCFSLRDTEATFDRILYADWRMSNKCMKLGTGMYPAVSMNYRQRQMPYLYRDNPVFFFRDTSASYYTPGYWKQPIPVLYTAPRVTTTAICPLFKTQKLLAGRALLCDRFDKRATDATSTPGWGMNAHRDGYNVLYGDGHAAWYGDPQQQLIFWPQPRKADIFSACLASTAYDPLLTAANDADAYYDNRNQGMLAWHYLDVAAGVDAGTPSD